MKTFKQFLYELKDPVKFAQRFAQRQMKKTASDPSAPKLNIIPDEDDPGPALHIRTRGYDPEHAENVFKAVEKREDEIIGNRAYFAGRQLVRRSERKRVLPISSLLPTQDHVSVGNPDTLRSKIETQPSEMGSLVRVAKFGGKYNIIDGHHRVLGAILRKDKEIPVRVFNVDRPKRKPKRKK